MMEFVINNWFSLIVVGVMIALYKGVTKSIENGISQIPQNMHDKRMAELKYGYDGLLQKDQFSAAQQLQVDNYYRTISGKNIQTLFSTWVDIIVDTDKVATLKTNGFKKMIKELVMYGSADSVRIGSIFMQYSYRGNEGKPTQNTYELLYLSAKLVASLKKDFTGYEVDPEDLLKMKINDLHKDGHEDLLKAAKANVEKIIKDGFDEISS